MATKNKPLRGKENTFAMVRKTTINSPEFLKLKNPARVAYLLLIAQSKYKGNYDVVFTYAQAEKFMERQTWSSAIKQLCELGFIKIKKQGGLYRSTNHYTLLRPFYYD